MTVTRYGPGTINGADFAVIVADVLRTLDQLVANVLAGAGVADGSVTDAKVATDAAIAQSKIAGLSASLAALASADSSEASVRAADDLLKLAKASNLSDLASAAAARTNLGLGTAAVLSAGSANGVAPLGSDGKIPNQYYGSITLSDFLGTVASQSAMLALMGERGDWCIRSDTGATWVLSGEPSSSLGNWVQLPSAGGVASVNGRTGVVTGLAELADIAPISDNTPAALTTLGDDGNDGTVAGGAHSHPTDGLAAFDMNGDLRFGKNLIIEAAAIAPTVRPRVAIKDVTHDLWYGQALQQDTGLYWFGGANTVEISGVAKNSSYWSGGFRSAVSGSSASVSFLASHALAEDLVFYTPWTLFSSASEFRTEYIAPTTTADALLTFKHFNPATNLDVYRGVIRFQPNQVLFDAPGHIHFRNGDGSVTYLKMFSDGSGVEMFTSGAAIFSHSPDGTRYKLTPPNGGGAASWVAA